MAAVLIGVLAAIAIGAFIVMAYRRGWRWTGISSDPGDGTPTGPPRPAKTLWDWLQLLIIPLVLALGAFALNATQADRDRKREDRRAAQDRAIAQDRAREDTLRVYLQQMSDLITKRGLREGRAVGDTRTLARTLTLIALRRLDRERKGLVLQFLLESKLINQTQEWTQSRRGLYRYYAHSDPLVSLSGADLRGIVVHALPLSIASGPSRPEVTVTADFDGANLRNANFRGAQISGATFEQADLRGADFGGADLEGASFAYSCLTGTRFNRASVFVSDFDPAATEIADFTDAEGRNVDFSGAQLAHANFEDARLTDVNLRGARTLGVRWPVGWTPTGTKMSRAEARNLCRDLIP